MGISRQAHYQSLARQRQSAEHRDRVIERVRHERMRQPRLGTRKLHHLLGEPLRQEGIKVGRDALFELLRRARMLVPARRAYHKTTHSHHYLRRHPNLLKAGVAGRVVATGCEQVWVADITYLPTHDRTVYVSLVTDAYSRKIVGWHVHASLQAEEVAQALSKALRDRKTRQTLVHHSDRGLQYCSSHYQQIHKRHRLTCSMTDGHDCYQNALAERINGILKGEFLLHRPADLRQAAVMVSQSVAIYNKERPHCSLQMKTPDEVHRASLAVQQQSAIQSV